MNFKSLITNIPKNYATKWFFKKPQVMTSEETAMGNYPVETIKYMRKITNEAWRNKYGK